jgi:hypothetical protein
MGAMRMSHVGLIAAAVLVAGCTGSNRTTSMPSVPTSAPPIRAMGSVTGVDELCAGPPSIRPRRATVHLIQDGEVVATSSVIAGDPAHDRYRLAVAPGHYLVRASNWRRFDRLVTVHGGTSARVDFVNFCY